MTGAQAKVRPALPIDSADGADSPATFVASADELRRLLDVVVAASGLICLAPLLLLIAIVIALDSHGHPIYVQWRTGYRGVRFRMFKFRTMVRDADALRESLRHRNHLRTPDFKVVGDPRVTRVGRIIRRYSLDELPQLLNVLKGEMTLVGPRPTSFPKEQYELWQLPRLDVRPGITGLWQINGRGWMQFAERVRMDLDYIERRSAWLDLVILLKTPWAVLRGDGVH